MSIFSSFCKSCQKSYNKNANRTTIVCMNCNSHYCQECINKRVRESTDVGDIELCPSCGQSSELIDLDSKNQITKAHLHRIKKRAITKVGAVIPSLRKDD